MGLRVVLGVGGDVFRLAAFEGGGEVLLMMKGCGRVQEGRGRGRGGRGEGLGVQGGGWGWGGAIIPSPLLLAKDEGGKAAARVRVRVLKSGGEAVDNYCTAGLCTRTLLERVHGRHGLSTTFLSVIDGTNSVLGQTSEKDSMS